MVEYYQENHDDTEGGSGTGTQGGQSGAVEFRSFVAMFPPTRDDLDGMPVNEKRKWMQEHQIEHESRVEKQKKLRSDRVAVKEGKTQSKGATAGYGSGPGGASSSSNYPAHPLLSQEAQFSGMDNQVNVLPSESEANTNEGERNELDNQYRLKYQPNYAPTFSPKPQYNG